MEGENSILNMVVYLFGVILGVDLFLGFEGVQIDRKKRQIREYYSLLGIRLGMWHPLEEYDTLTLQIDRFTIRTSSPFTLRRSTAHRTFDVLLVGPKNEAGILLFECKDYGTGKDKLDSTALKLKIATRDLCIEDMKKSLQRRKVRRRR